MQEVFYQPKQEPDPYFERLRAEAATDGRRCVVNAIVMEAGKALILRRAPWKSFLPNCWDLPGGHVTPDEFLEMALRREVGEELGTNIRSIDALIAVWDWERAAPRHREVARQFEFMVTLAESGPSLSIDAREFTQHRWISALELPVMLENRAPGDEQMLKVLRRAFEVSARKP